MASFFRKEALDTVSTPEQLDQQVRIMRPSAWAIYSGIVIATLTLLLWSLTYHITDGVNMQGVIFTNSNIVQSVAANECLVTDVLTEEGDYVQIGDLMAVVSNDDLLKEIQSLRNQIEQLEDDSDASEHLRQQLTALIDTYVASTMIKSSSSGYVQRVKSPGSALAPGESIATVVSDYGYNEVVAYVPLQQAGSLSLGMTAQVSPTYASREEYGYMTGIVTYIGETPVSEESIQAKMGSSSYVADILPDTSCVEVRIRLDLDDTMENGYRWSNRKGGTLNVKMGTTCSVIVVTDKYLPITLLFS